MSTPESSPAPWIPTAAESARTAALVDDYVEQERVIARARARQAEAMVGLAEIATAQGRRSGSESDYDFAMRSMAAELGAAARVADGTVRRRLADAVTLVTGFPATFAALQDGRISGAHARVIVAAGERIDDDDSRAEYEAIVASRAERLTVGGLRSLANAVADRIDPLPLAERQAEAMDQRGLWTEPGQDGMADLVLRGPATTIRAIHDRATQMGTTIKAASRGTDDHRTLDHIRADLLIDLALTAAPAARGEGLYAIHATVQVTIPVETLTGIGDDSAFLAGYGPIDAATARRLAANASTWARLWQNRDGGALLAVDAYTPTAAQRRLLAARDEHCRFPGCRRPARLCDVDPPTRGAGPPSWATSHTSARRTTGSSTTHRGASARGQADSWSSSRRSAASTPTGPRPRCASRRCPRCPCPT